MQAHEDSHSHQLASMLTWMLAHLRGMCSTAPAITAAMFSMHCTSLKDDRAALRDLSTAPGQQAADSLIHHKVGCRNTKSTFLRVCLSHCNTSISKRPVLQTARASGHRLEGSRAQAMGRPRLTQTLVPGAGCR